MKILINASNLKAGGGLQVADSICRLLYMFPAYEFEVVLSEELKQTGNAIHRFGNVRLYYYTFRNTIRSLLFMKDSFLDGLVKNSNVDVVLTIFGPSRWKPQVPHLCGFARAQVLPMDTPYFTRASIKERLFNAVIKRSFKRSSDYYWTENSAITGLLKKVFPRKQVFTVSNNYNQIYDNMAEWQPFALPSFDGITLLTVSNSYPHKNLIIAKSIAELLLTKHPGFRFRFVFTISETDYPELDNNLREHFLFVGTVSVSECPSLYKQADIMFQPSLLECFTATYPEAMKMGVPIITTDLDFSRGLCGDAALFYSATSADDAAEKIFDLSTDTELYSKLQLKGLEQLGNFDSPLQRVEKLIQILQSLVN